MCGDICSSSITFQFQFSLQDSLKRWGKAVRLLHGELPLAGDISQP